MKTLKALTLGAAAICLLAATATPTQQVLHKTTFTNPIAKIHCPHASSLKEQAILALFRITSLAMTLYTIPRLRKAT